MKRSPGDWLPTFEIQRQPDDISCGATCLHAMYRYFGDEIPFAALRDEIPTLETGGTLGVYLATHALRRGYRAQVFTWNLEVFDPTWFGLTNSGFQGKLLARAECRGDSKLARAARAYATLLDEGGEISFEDLVPSLLRRFLRRRLPILAGLSATYLYRQSRERAVDDVADDVDGDPVGHFTVLTGYSPGAKQVHVTDPMYPNPLSTQHTYPVPIERVVGSIYLGVLTYDANLVVLEPPR